MPDENMNNGELNKLKMTFKILNESNDKKAHLNALIEIRQQIQNIQSDELNLLNGDIDTYLLPCFKTESDSCRETAIDIVTDFIKSGKCSNMILLLIFQNLVSRLASAELVEKTEEIRLKLIQLLHEIMKAYGRINHFSCYLDSIIRILNNTLRDEYSSVVEESCKCICQLAECLQLNFHTKASQLLKQTLEALKHQQSKIRIEAIFATGTLILHSSESAKDAMAFFFDLLFDEKENVRKTVYIVVSRLLSICRDRDFFEQSLVLLMLSGLNDSFDKNRQEAEERWEKIGMEFLASDKNGYDPYQVYNEKNTTVYSCSTYYEPNEGCKLIVKKHLCHIIAQVIPNLDCWKKERQLLSANLLKIIIIHAESSIAKHVDDLLHVIVQTYNLKNLELLVHLIEIVQLIASVVDVPKWIDSVVNIFKHSFSCQHYPILTELISRSNHKCISNYLKDLLPIFKSKLFCDTDCLKFKDSKYSCQESILLCIDKMSSLSNIGEHDLKTIYEVVFIKTAELKLSGTNYNYGLKVMKSLAMNLHIFVDQLHEKYLHVIFTNWFKKEEIICTERTIEILFESVLVNTNFLRLTNYYKDVLKYFRDMLNDNESRKASLIVNFFIILSKVFASNEENLTFDIDSNEFVDLFLVSFIKDCLKPGLNWTPGAVSEKTRSAFIVCHISLISLLIRRRTSRLPDQIITLLKLTDQQMISFLNEQLESSRRNVLVYFRLYVRLMMNHDSGIDSDYVHRISEAILPHFDDSKESVRIEAFNTIECLFSILNESLKLSSSSSLLLEPSHSYRIKTILESIILFFDDVDCTVQNASYNCIKSIFNVYPTVCIDVIKSMKKNLMNIEKCDHLIQSFSTRI